MSTPINKMEDIKICDADKIYSSVHKNWKMWKEVMDDMIVEHTLLHEAAAVGNTAAAVEILNLMPSLGRKLNQDGMSPLHVAIDRGQGRTVRALVKFDPGLVRVKGKEGETPLMLCAAKANNHEDKKLLAMLLLACPQSVRDVNNNGETVVHVALRKNCGVVCILVDWLERRNEIASVLTMRDVDGNTALHAAARFGCAEGARKLVKLVKINRMNHEGKTALDIADECGEVEVAQVLKERRARKAGDPNFSVLTTADYVLRPPILAESVSRAYFSLTKQLTLDMRGAILVVATVILTATYQGVMQPPGGLYPAPEQNTTATTTTTTATAAAMHVSRHHVRRWLDEKKDGHLPHPHLAGQMVMSSDYYYVFMPANTFAFALSAVIVIFVVPGSPIFLILLICLLFMCISYLLALDAIAYYTGFSRVIFYLSFYAIVSAYLVKLCYYPAMALLVDQDWWLRRHISVRFSNWSTGSGWNSTGLMKKAEMMKMQNRLMSLDY